MECTSIYFLTLKIYCKLRFCFIKAFQQNLLNYILYILWMIYIYFLLKNIEKTRLIQRDSNTFSYVKHELIYWSLVSSFDDCSREVKLTNYLYITIRLSYSRFIIQFIFKIKNKPHIILHSQFHHHNTYSLLC